MLKRIKPEDVQVGMFIHGFEGSWLKHPFWQTRFLLGDPCDLALLQASDVSAVIIDVSRGIAPKVAERVSTTADEHIAGDSCYDAPKADGAHIRGAIDRGRLVAKEIYERARVGQPVDLSAAAPMVSDIAECVARNPALFFDMTRLKSKDQYTYLHSVSVCGLMVNLAREIGLDEETVRAMGLAGLLHDVGKMAVPAAVLNKPGRLTEEEFACIKMHPEQGHAMLRDGEGINRQVLEVCLYHHEKIDGSGYPFGLRGEEISLAARMGAICDVYDALTSDRVYKEGWTPVRAVSEMDGWKGHFDEELLFAFCRSLGIGPTGRLVRLRSERLGVVLPDGTQGTRSKIRVFYSTAKRRPIPLEDVFRGLGDLALGAEDPAAWGFTDWDATVRNLMDGHMVAPGG